MFFSHRIIGENASLNETLGRCQVKKSLNPETNISVSYGADKQMTSLKRSMHTISAKSDMKLTGSN